MTLNLLEEVKKGKYDVFISEVVIREINRAPEAKARSLAALINELDLGDLHINNDSLGLAKKYIEAGIIPVKYEDDALHIAVASVNNLDAIVSWNFAHIVKLKTKREVIGINIINGYKEIEICSPPEVIE